MDKLENLDNLQFLVTELVGSIRQNIIEDNMPLKMKILTNWINM